MDFRKIFKFNENHDESGRFASGGGSGGGASSSGTPRSLSQIAADIVHDSFWTSHDNPGTNTGGGAEAPFMEGLLSFHENQDNTFDALNTKERAIVGIEGALKHLDWYHSDRSEEYKAELEKELARLKALPKEKVKTRLFPSGPESTLDRGVDERG